MNVGSHNGGLCCIVFVVRKIVIFYIAQFGFLLFESGFFFPHKPFRRENKVEEAYSNFTRVL